MAKAKGLYKRGEVWWIRYAGLSGKICFESSGSTLFKAASDLLIQRKKEVLEGKETVPTRKSGKQTLKELAEHYIAWGEGRQKGFKTKKDHLNQLLPVFGNHPLRAFSTRLVEEWQTQRMAFNKPATVNRLLSTLKHMFTKAVEWDLVGEETLRKVRKVKRLPENNRRLRYLPKEECQALINGCSAHLKPIVITALNTGMRKEEILSLEWDKHIDLKHGFILLDKTKNGERREIPINQTVRSTLQEMIRRVDTPHVFTDDEGSRFKNVKKSFKSALTKAGIKDFHFHDLRHTFASHLVMAGIDLTTVKELLGHKTLSMTLRYAHLSPTHKARAVEVLDRTLQDGVSPEKSSERSTIQKLYNPTKKELAGVR